MEKSRNKILPFSYHILLCIAFWCVFNEVSPVRSLVHSTYSTRWVRPSPCLSSGPCTPGFWDVAMQRGCPSGWAHLKFQSVGEEAEGTLRV